MSVHAEVHLESLPPIAPSATVPIVSSVPQVPRRLTEADAIDIWIARWLRIKRSELLTRYGCDPRRLYEVWQEERFLGSRAKAIVLFRERYPALVDRIDYGRHHRISRTSHPDQLSLFE